jgi:hypothetical protein
MQKSPATAIRLRILLSTLPKPIAIYRSRRVIFEVYRAKDIHDTKWNNLTLKKLVIFCRESYSRYGKRSSLDLYDRKAAIYLTRAIYTQYDGRRAEEWLSLRMVPGSGKPIGVAEPEIYQFKGKSIDYWMKKRIGKNKFWDHVASSSRMCGIHPYVTENNGGIHFLDDEKHYHTSILFALMHEQFILDYPIARFPYKYITGMMRPDFYRRSLGYAKGKKIIYPTLTPASRFLEIKSSDISVKRETYSYAFPLYWLDIKKLLKLINALRGKEKKPPLQKLTPDMLSNLSSRVKHPVVNAGIKIKPSTMREMIDKFVPDAPELKITRAKVWYGSMEALLRAARVVPW